MTGRTREEIESEVAKRVQRRLDTAKTASRASAAKLKARATELSELLGWMRGNIQEEKT